MEQILLQCKKSICKNIYCKTKLIGFDEGKKFCIKCRRNEKELKWICEECHYNLISSNSNNLSKRICDICSDLHRRKRNRRSYYKRIYKYSPKAESIPWINRVESNFRLFTTSMDLLDKSKDRVSVCNYCDNQIIIKFGYRNREFCSESCKIANHGRLNRYLKQSLKTIEICMNEERLVKDFDISIFENCSKGIHFFSEVGFKKICMICNKEKRKERTKIYKSYEK
jgi:hypothetical protein